MRRSLVILALVVSSCRAEEHAPPPPAPRPPAIVAPAMVAPAAATLSVVHGTVFRWPDGDWVVRVTVLAENRASTPVAVARRDFVTAPSMTPWALASTFPDTVALDPGQRAEGDVAWYTGRTEALPASVNVQNGTWSAVVTLDPAPLPPPAGMNARQVTGRVEALFPGDGTTWRYTDGDHIVRAPVQIANATNVPLSIPLAYFGAQIGETRGALWLDGSTLADPLELAPGQGASGFVAWYWSSVEPVPTSVSLRFGSAEQPFATANVAVAPGPPIAAE